MAAVAALMLQKNSSLRPDDISASALMARFYQRLAQGENASSALRNAKLDLLAKYGDQLSPFYWAAFITVGETSTPIGIKRQ